MPASDRNPEPQLPNRLNQLPTNEPSFPYAVAAIVVDIAILITGIVVLDLPSSVTIFCAYLATLALSIPITRSYRIAQDHAFDAVRRAQEPIFILLAVGALLGAWMISGTIPTLIHVGLEAVSPDYFLITALLLCSIVSIATGTAFGSIGTVGVALIAVASGLGVPLGPTAAAIVCGAIFGDKLSPLSDTTNLASAIAGSTLLHHIRHMMWTTIPAYLITAGFFLALDLLEHKGSADLDKANAMLATIEGRFDVGLINLAPVLVVIGLLVLRMPAFPALMLGAFAALPVAIWNQGAPFTETMLAMFDGSILETGDPAVDDLLSGGGVAGMLGVVVIVMIAVALGGLLGGSGMLRVIISRLTGATKSATRVMLSTLGVTMVANVVTASQTTALVVGGTLMRPSYKRHNLHPKNLSRALEDVGTMTSFVIPWNTAAIFAVGVLGVSVGEYGPYAVFSYLTPIISAIYAVTGFTIARTEIPVNDSVEPIQRQAQS